MQYRWNPLHLHQFFQPITFFSTMPTNKARVISVLNFKGGVGKTTTTLNLGAALAKKSKRVLLIDLDVQMNTSFMLSYSIRDGDSIYELMSGSTPSYPVYDTNTPGLQFIPSSMKLDTLTVELTNRVSRETVLRRQLVPLLPHFDYILIDCPPGKSVLTDNALVASDSVLIPITCEEMNKQGISTILTKYEEIKELINPDLTIEGFLLTKYNKQYTVSREMRMSLEGRNVKVFNTAIRTSMSLNRYCLGYQNVFEYDEKTYKPGFGKKFAYSNGAVDYMQLADEILASQ